MRDAVVKAYAAAAARTAQTIPVITAIILPPLFPGRLPLPPDGAENEYTADKYQ
jgi:hypothetical protein